MLVPFMMHHQDQWVCKPGFAFATLPATTEDKYHLKVQAWSEAPSNFHHWNLALSACWVLVGCLCVLGDVHKRSADCISLVAQQLLMPPHAALTAGCAAAGCVAAAVAGVRLVTFMGMPLAVWMVAPVAMPTCAQQRCSAVQ